MIDKAGLPEGGGAVELENRLYLYQVPAVQP